MAEVERARSMRWRRAEPADPEARAALVGARRGARRRQGLGHRRGERPGAHAGCDADREKWSRRAPRVDRCAPRDDAPRRGSEPSSPCASRRSSAGAAGAARAVGVSGVSGVSGVERRDGVGDLDRRPRRYLHGDRRPARDLAVLVVRHGEGQPVGARRKRGPRRLCLVGPLRAMGRACKPGRARPGVRQRGGVRSRTVRPAARLARPARSGLLGSAFAWPRGRRRASAEARLAGLGHVDARRSGCGRGHGRRGRGGGSAPASAAGRDGFLVSGGLKTQ